MKANASGATGAAQAGSSFLGTLLGNGGSTAGTQSAAAQLGGVKTNVDTGGVASAASKLSDPNSLAQTTGSGAGRRDLRHRHVGHGRRSPTAWRAGRLR